MKSQHIEKTIKQHGTSLGIVTSGKCQFNILKYTSWTKFCRPIKIHTMFKLHTEPILVSGLFSFAVIFYYFISFNFIYLFCFCFCLLFLVLFLSIYFFCFYLFIISFFVYFRSYLLSGFYFMLFYFLSLSYFIFIPSFIARFFSLRSTSVY